MSKKYCNVCKKEMEILEKKVDENGHPYEILSCHHETPRRVTVVDQGKGYDKIDINRLWDSLSIAFISILITVWLTILFGLWGVTKKPCIGIIGSIIGVILIGLFLKKFRNFLIKHMAWIRK